MFVCFFAVVADLVPDHLCMISVKFGSLSPWYLRLGILVVERTQTSFFRWTISFFCASVSSPAVHRFVGGFH